MVDSSGPGAVPPVFITLAGGLLVHAPGVTLDGSQLRSHRAETVFARLAVDAGRGVSRGVLAEAVWGAWPPASWESALRNVVTALRRWVGTGALEQAVVLRTASDSYRLDLPDGSRVDVIAAERQAGHAEALLRSGDPDAALLEADELLACLARPVMEGVAGEWVNALRLESEETRARLERVAGEAALAVGDATRAERVARAQIAAAPLREDGHRLLMRALRATGNPAEALAAYDACRRLLADELGAMPAPETHALFLEILVDGDHPARETGRQARPPVFAAPLALVQGQTPFVGRTALLDELSRHLRLAGDAGPITVCLRGEPGLGKTRLAAELAARVHEQGKSVLYGRADDRISVPYGCVLEALHGALAAIEHRRLTRRLGPHAATMRRLLPMLGRDDAPPEDRLENLPRPRIEQAILAALGVVCEGGGALLVLDDMQWASRPEIQLVDALASAGQRLPLLVLVLHRSAADLDGLRPGSRVVDVCLEPLTEEEVTALAGALGFDGPHEHRATLASDAWRLSGGNPLLSSELLRSWRNGNGHERSTRIGELVRERLALLAPNAEGVLQAAAVAGLEFDPDIVAAASGGAAHEARATLDQARGVGLLVPATRDARWLAFRHALVRSALADSLTPDGRLRIHQRLGSALEAEAPMEGDALVGLAYHFGAAAPLGDWRRAVRYGLPVARTAYDARVYDDVVAIATRTIDALRSAGDPDPSARLDLEVLLGGAQRALGLASGFETLREAFASARALGDALRAADAALAFSDRRSTSEELFIDENMLAIYREAVDALGGVDPRRRARLLGRIAAASAWSAGRGEAGRLADEAVAMARELGDTQTLSRVLFAVRQGLAGSGRGDEQERLEDDLIALGDRQDDPGLRLSGLMFRFVTRIEQGRGAALENLFARAVEDALVLPPGGHRHTLAYNRAALALLRGRVAEADLLVTRAAEVGREHGLDASIVEMIRITQMIGIRHEQGRAAQMRRDEAAFFGGSEGTRWPGVAFLDAEAGLLGHVGANVDQLMDGFTATGPTVLRPMGLIAQMAAPIARIGDAARAARLHDLVAPFGGQGVFLGYFAGPVDYHLGLLCRVLGRGDEAARRFRDAAAFSRELGAPRWVERCRAALADADRGAVIRR